MGDLLDRRRAQTAARFAGLREHLAQSEGICHGKACVYATGSFARGEANEHSDLDLFIVGQAREGKRILGRLDEILLKADLIEATRRLGIPEFSGDGQYLVHYTAEQLVRSLGKPEDDATNTFTARLLLMLESRPLLEADVYRGVIEEALAAYRQDFEDHRNAFIPAFLANDIPRLWRTFCVNYEAGTARVPEEKQAKRRIKNYKLKHSRLLTCYSALLYLLMVYDRAGTVTPRDAAEMASMTPTERVEWLRKRDDSTETNAALEELLAAYERFLESTDKSEAELIGLHGPGGSPRVYESRSSLWRFGVPRHGKGWTPQSLSSAACCLILDTRLGVGHGARAEAPFLKPTLLSARHKGWEWAQNCRKRRESERPRYVRQVCVQSGA